MTGHVGRDALRERIKDELTTRSWNIADLAREAGVDSGTIGDFVNGVRWPQMATRSKIAMAFGWTPDSLGRIERGEPPVPATISRGTGTSEVYEIVGAVDQDAGVLLSLPEDALQGLTPAEREEVVTAAKLKALETAREIRRRLNEQ